jgi:hypothetical protein
VVRVLVAGAVELVTGSDGGSEGVRSFNNGQNAYYRKFVERGRVSLGACGTGGEREHETGQDRVPYPCPTDPLQQDRTCVRLVGGTLVHYSMGGGLALLSLPCPAVVLTMTVGGPARR